MNISRRHSLKLIGTGATALAVSPSTTFAQAPEAVMKKIPSSGEELPVIGMGTWRTFNVGGDKVLRDARTEVLKAFFAKGGGMVGGA